jgi:Tol biopolymer transport system component
MAAETFPCAQTSTSTTITASPQSPSTDIAITATRNEKAKLFLGFIGTPSQDIITTLHTLKKDLEFSEQFEVYLCTLSKLMTKKELTQLADKDFTLVIFITENVKKDQLEWRLYDSALACMVEGKKYQKIASSLPRGWGHCIADALWPILTSEQGFFATKIAYCIEKRVAGHHPFKHIYLTDYDGSNLEPLVTTATVNIAPRFNQSSTKPLLFYSETTNYNIRLSYTSMHKKNGIASNCDGVTMTSSFSKEGESVVYCASKGKGSCQLYHHTKKGTKKLTNTTGNNVSPSLSDDGTIVYYCADHETNTPQIYC